MEISGRPRLIGYGLAWIVASNAVDLALTLLGVDQGIIAEANPLMAPLLSASPAGLVALKSGLVLGGVAALHWAYPRRPRFTGGAIGFLSLVMGYVMWVHVGWVIR